MKSVWVAGALTLLGIFMNLIRPEWMSDSARYLLTCFFGCLILICIGMVLVEHFQKRSTFSRTRQLLNKKIEKKGILYYVENQKEPICPVCYEDENKIHILQKDHYIGMNWQCLRCTRSYNELFGTVHKS